MVRSEVRLYSTFGLLMGPMVILTLLPYSQIPSITILNWILQLAVLMVLVGCSVVSRWDREVNLLGCVRLYILIVVWGLVRGALFADNYWDWKFLVENTSALLLVLAIFPSRNPNFVGIFLSVYFRFILIVSVIFYAAAGEHVSSDALGFILMPLSMAAVLLPLLPRRWLFAVLFLMLFVVATSLGARSNVIKFLVATIIGAMLWLGLVNRRKLTSALLWLVLSAGPFFLLLGLLQVFNVFQIDQYISADLVSYEKSAGEVAEVDLRADTRSALYGEVLVSSVSNEYWLMGRTQSRGNDTVIFLDKDIIGRGERIANEAGVLNIYTWFGLVGLIAYGYIFARASWLAVERANNRYMRAMGLFVAFGWLYSWVENFTNFSLPFLTTWVSVGMCFSSSLRGMTDAEFKSWFTRIFETESSSRSTSSQ